MQVEPMVTNRLKQITLLLLDVDGVLTDGSIIYDDNNAETKFFNSKDGLGLHFLMDSGIHVGIVTGRRSEALMNRCKNLGITLVFDGVHDKAAVLEQILAENEKVPDEIAFMGDDLPDLPLMKKVGLSIAVADAHEAVCMHADMVTSAGGGKGAVREVCEAILKAKGLWEEILTSYLQ